MNKTYVAKRFSQPTWFIVDAKDKTLGRMCTQVAHALKNKHSIYYAPYQARKSYIVIINASFIQISGQKKYQKKYRKHSGRPGGLKEESFMHLQKRIPERIVEKAIKGMLPKNVLGRKLFTYLKIYPGANHPHQVNNLIPLPTQQLKPSLNK